MMQPMEREVNQYRAIGDWRILCEGDESSSPLSYAMEESVGEAVARGEAPATLRIWRGPRAIVVSKKDIRTEQAQHAAAMMRQADWPVFVRQSGGTAVPHGPGTLNLSLFLPRPQKDVWNIDEVYRMLGLPLMRMLRDTFGLDSYFGEVPGSFCDGRYNVVIRGKKVVGTSQVWKGGPAGLVSKRPGYILAHATLLTYIRREEAVSALNAFYELAEGTKPVYTETVATLNSWVEGSAPSLDRRVTEGLVTAIRDLTGADGVSRPSEREREAARAFLEHCRPEYYLERAQRV
ncbi:lipoate--protein ligase family protein [Paludifilum halophilum]|uniref:BPL/LPL catalytic domain-containing protein n=1 Tax=Paludifilum halophilum TaxID=1642702 RepID=A0A235B5D1_9BACL|nr:hypothetical protein [Paludifilum halophilum]OYD07442.1 hypothetical protein CHM34_11095 [Paludifilum halophilum]